MASEDTRKERLSVADQVIWWVGSVAANGSVSGAAASECRALIEGIERALHAAQSQLAETTAALGRAQQEREKDKADAARWRMARHVAHECKCACDDMGGEIHREIIAVDLAPWWLTMPEPHEDDPALDARIDDMIEGATLRAIALREKEEGTTHG